MKNENLDCHNDVITKIVWPDSATAPSLAVTSILASPSAFGFRRDCPRRYLRFVPLCATWKEFIVKVVKHEIFIAGGSAFFVV